VYAVYTPGGGSYDGIVTPCSDTSFEVEKTLFESYRRMSPQKRSAIGFELSDNMRDIAFDSYRSSNPTKSRQELQLGFLESVLGWRLPQQLRSTLVERRS
jgi:hypothetical protein